MSNVNCLPPEIPLGYDVEDKAQVVNPEEATVIRTNCAGYLGLGSVRRLFAQPLDWVKRLQILGFAHH